MILVLTLKCWMKILLLNMSMFFVVALLMCWFVCYRGGTSSAASFVNLGLSIDSPYPMHSKKWITSAETIPEHRRVQTTAW